MVAELIEVAGECTKDFGKKRIKPRDILLAARKDEELSVFLEKVDFPNSGVLPNIHQSLIKKIKKKKEINISEEV